MILDTNALSAYAENDRGLIARLPRDRPFYLSVVVLGEFRFGLHGSNQGSILEAWLDELIAAVIILPVDEGTAVRYGEIRHDLKQKNIQIPPNDSWIAAQALQHGYPILSQDKHFDHIEKIERITW